MYATTLQEVSSAKQRTTEDFTLAMFASLKVITMALVCVTEKLTILRTHDEFYSDDIPYSEHRIGESPLLNLGIDFTTQFPWDSMHLLYLGIMKKLLHIWVEDRSTSKKAKLSARLIDELSQELINLNEFVPSSFARRPRSLIDLDRWKATEYRSFLLYIGPIVILWSEILCLQCAQFTSSSKWLFELWKTYRLWRFSIWESTIYHKK